MAQRFTNTFFPLNCDRSITWLLVFIIRNAGSPEAEVATAGGGARTGFGIEGCDVMADSVVVVSFVVVGLEVSTVVVVLLLFFLVTVFLATVFLAVAFFVTVFLVFFFY